MFWALGSATVIFDAAGAGVLLMYRGKHSLVLHYDNWFGCDDGNDDCGIDAARAGTHRQVLHGNDCVQHDDDNCDSDAAGLVYRGSCLQALH